MCSSGPCAASCSPTPEPGGPDGLDGSDDSHGHRLALYRRAGEALDRFFSRWTAAFCVRCLEVTRGYHRGDPRADVDVVEGVFPPLEQ